MSKNEDSEFSFTQLYGVIYVHLKNEGDTLPFFLGRLGFNRHTGNNAFENQVYGSNTDLENGIYCAVGFGFNSKHNILAILFSINNSSGNTNIIEESDGSTYTKSTETHDGNYQKISIVYGLNFNKYSLRR